MTEPKATPKATPKLNVGSFKLAEYARNVFALTPTPGTEAEHLLNSGYWSLVAAQLQPHSRIEAISEENTWFAEFIVVSAGRNWAKVVMLRYVQLDSTSDEKAQPADSQFEVNWGGVSARHRVVRKADKSTLKDGFSTKAEAVKWLQDYEVNALAS